MPVGPEAKVDTVEHRGRTGDPPKSRGVWRSRGFQIGRSHRHIVDLLGGQRRMIEKAFAQVG